MYEQGSRDTMTKVNGSVALVMTNGKCNARYKHNGNKNVMM